MLELFFFILGLLNSILLIIIFIIRKIRLDILKRFGWIYLLLGIPAAYGVFLVFQEHKTIQYTIFLGIFLGFIAIEGIYDFILKAPFREKNDWKLLVPYLALYFASSYGFVVMTWKISLTGGLILTGLFVIQIIANILTHPVKNKNKSSKTI